MSLMLPILADNARILAGSFRSMNAANTASKTAVVQRGTVLTLSCVRDDGDVRIILKIEVKEPRDRYTTEIRDITNMAFTGETLIVETDTAVHRFVTIEEFPPVKPAPCYKPTYTYW